MASRPIYENHNGHSLNLNHSQSHPEPLHWSEFCEEQAAIAASEFYVNFRSYLNDNPDISVRDPASAFLQSFIDCLQNDFYRCIERGQPIRERHRSYPSAENFPYDRSSPISSNDVDSPKASKARSFLRKLSIRKPKKSNSKESTPDDDHHSHRSKSKQRSNIKKEGTVFRLVENGPSTDHKWEKCRLVLVNSSSGYLLEFYAPPKVNFAIISHIALNFNSPMQS